RAPSIAYCAAHVGGVRRIRAIRLAESGGPMHQRKLDRKRRRLLAEGATRPLAPHSAMWLDGPVAGPHDSIVKAFFANTEDAASALASALPNAIAERIDWSSLRHANLNLVDRKLRAYFSDIVFTARIQEHEVILYVLLEHQSTNDPLMPFRMLRYCVLLWDAFLKDNPDSKQLPALIPVVLHHGQQSWTSPTELSEIIDLPDDVQRLAGNHIPNFRFLLDDLSAVDDETLR